MNGKTVHCKYHVVEDYSDCSLYKVTKKQIQKNRLFCSIINKMLNKDNYNISFCELLLKSRSILSLAIRNDSKLCFGNS